MIDLRPGPDGTIRLTCESCDNPFAWKPDGRKRPERCPTCREQSSKASQAAYRERQRAMQAKRSSKAPAVRAKAVEPEAEDIGPLDADEPLYKRHNAPVVMKRAPVVRGREIDLSHPPQDGADDVARSGRVERVKVQTLNGAAERGTRSF